MKTIKTKRLLLRPPCEDDFSIIKEWFLDLETTKYIGGIRLEERSRKSFDRIMNDWKKKGIGNFIVELSETKVVIGVCGVSDVEVDGKIENDLGVIFAKEFWRNGYASEAVLEVMKFSVNELGLSRITAWPNEANTASVQGLKRLGFKFEKKITPNDPSVSYPEMSLFAWTGKVFPKF